MIKVFTYVDPTNSTLVGYDNSLKTKGIKTINGKNLTEQQQTVIQETLFDRGMHFPLVYNESDEIIFFGNQALIELGLMSATAQKDDPNMFDSVGNIIMDAPIRQTRRKDRSSKIDLGGKPQPKASSSMNLFGPKPVSTTMTSTEINFINQLKTVKGNGKIEMEHQDSIYSLTGDRN